MNTSQFLIIPEQVDVEKLVLLASEPCERFTGSYICSDDPGLSFDAPYTADRYCNSCRLRTAVGFIRIKPIQKQGK